MNVKISSDFPEGGIEKLSTMEKLFLRKKWSPILSLLFLSDTFFICFASLSRTGSPGVRTTRRPMSPPLRTATRRRLPAVWTTTPSPSSGPGWSPSSVSAACSAARWSASSPGQAKKQSSIGGTGLRIRPIWRLRSGHPLFLAAHGGWGGEGGYVDNCFNHYVYVQPFQSR